MKRTFTLALAGAALAVAAIAGPTAAKTTPDVGCMRAGISTLQSVGLLDDVARGGIAIGTAVGFGVTVRPGADIAGVPESHSGSESCWPTIGPETAACSVYPWCEA